MIALIRALDAERIKLRRTLALVLTFVIPLAIVLLQFASAVDHGPVATLRPGEGETLWQALFSQSCNLWSLLMLPLFVTLVAALVAGIDHAQDHWKQIYALPVRRGTIYTAKLLINLGLIALSLLALLAYTVIFGLALDMLYPTAGIGTHIPWGYALTLLGIIYLGSTLVVSLHTWVSLRWKSFVVPSALGIVMTVAGMIVIQSKYGPYYPWTLSAVAMLSYLREGFPTKPLLLSLVGGALVALLGGWEVTRRDVL